MQIPHFVRGNTSSTRQQSESTRTISADAQCIVKSQRNRVMTHSLALLASLFWVDLPGKWFLLPSRRAPRSRLSLPSFRRSARIGRCPRGGSTESPTLAFPPTQRSATAMPGSVVHLPSFLSSMEEIHRKCLYQNLDASQLKKLFIPR